MTGLWTGKPFSYNGKHYKLQGKEFMPPPPPIQQPHIPIWVVGAYPSEKSMGRAMRYDGIIPQAVARDGKSPHITAQGLPEIVAYIKTHRTQPGPFEIITEGTTPGDDPAAARVKVQPWAAAGATWWIESMWDAMDKPEAVLERIRHGPPRL